MSRTEPGLSLVVDRTACTGHGVCAGLVPERVSLDEWGYPVLLPGSVDAARGEKAVRLCPARALAWRADLTQAVVPAGAGLGGAR